MANGDGGIQNYTLGFIFDIQMARVVLMEKTRPKWQEGKLNGVGGKVEKSEVTIECMVREIKEETGLVTQPSDWTAIATLRGLDWNVEVFAMIYEGSELDVKTTSDEKVAWYAIDAIPGNRLTNILWQIELAKDRLQNKKINYLGAEHRGMIGRVD